MALRTVETIVCVALSVAGVALPAAAKAAHSRAALAKRWPARLPPPIDAMQHGVEHSLRRRVDGVGAGWRRQPQLWWWMQKSASDRRGRTAGA